MSSGRVHALAVATRPAGQVVYERFYDAFSEAEKGEVRGCWRGKTPFPGLAAGLERAMPLLLTLRSLPNM